MKKKTILDIVVDRLNETGEVSNFWCIDNRITTRLSDAIFRLNKRGWEFEGDYIGDTKNFQYRVISRPKLTLF